MSFPSFDNKGFNKFFQENTEFKNIFENSSNFEEVLISARDLARSALSEVGLRYYESDINTREDFEQLEWRDFAAIRLLDYVDNEGRSFIDLNLRGAEIISHPIKNLYLAFKGEEVEISEDFIEDMDQLFKQFRGELGRSLPTREEVEKWMEKHPSGLDKEIQALQEKNKERILKLMIQKMDSGEIKGNSKFSFEEGLDEEGKYQQALEWWKDKNFHLLFALRTPELLNELLDNTLDQETMEVLKAAEEKGIPFFINPYYLSLLNVNEPDFAKNADSGIRDYIIYTQDLVDEFGHIVAWEKEDVVEAGKPNFAGWVLPSHSNVHRRYPEVAILIPDTVGRACAGLCTSCQRMYGFQKGQMNFDLNKLKPEGTWWERLPKLLKYYETDAQLRDILITGGDALMSSDASLKRILDEIYEMALRKKKANDGRAEGKKYAEMLRLRLGTRLPVYLPQRITDELTSILAEFKEKASKIGMKQFVIQTHFESPMEVTPEVVEAIKKLNSAGWIVTNQLVFITASSRRGHTVKLRKVLNDIGVLTYYTFSVKGYQENKHNFVNNARAVQEQIEEKYIGEIPEKYYDEVSVFPLSAEKSVENIEGLRKKIGIPFLATDRNVLNLPGVGKSLTFRVIGITDDGRRILEFDHDHNRNHSLIIEQMGKVIIIESKTIAEYLKQIEGMGEDIAEYESLYGYSIGQTEPRIPIYEYPEYDFETTDELTNLEILSVG